jgi:5-methylcytosine-specific restriction protein A
MPNRAPSHRCKPEKAAGVVYERRASASARGYDRTWQRLRLMVLAAEPLCRHCAAAGRATTATEVHHVIPIRDRPDMRLNRSNLVPLCKPCHSVETERENRGLCRP